MTQILLIEDVDGLGRKGDVVKAKPGHFRNFLLPQRMAVAAEKHTLLMQSRLQEERKKQAVIDRQIADQLAAQVHGLTLSVNVKVDPDGHMYGSVSTADIVEILVREGIEVERRFIRLGQSIRKIGLHPIDLRLKEGVECSFKLKVLPEGETELPAPPPPPVVEEQVPPPSAEEEEEPAAEE